MSHVLNVVLTHQSPSEVDRLAAYWRDRVNGGRVLIAYGGPREHFDQIQSKGKTFVDDPNLRTVDHQREGQSYTGVFKAASRWLKENSSNADFVTLFECDHMPLVADLNQRQVERMRAEEADVLAYHLAQVDGTSHAHFLYYAGNSEFGEFLRKVSVRKNQNTVLSMFGTGSCWTREAFDMIGEFGEPFPIYFEVYLPTLAHHLGFRLRDYGNQDEFVSNLGDRSRQIARARGDGAWSLHPVKNLASLLSS